MYPVNNNAMFTMLEEPISMFNVQQCAKKERKDREFLADSAAVVRIGDVDEESDNFLTSSNIAT